MAFIHIAKSKGFGVEDAQRVQDKVGTAETIESAGEDLTDKTWSYRTPAGAAEGSRSRREASRAARMVTA